jgi:hypothetical protein
MSPEVLSDLRVPPRRLGEDAWIVSSNQDYGKQEYRSGKLPACPACIAFAVRDSNDDNVDISLRELRY